MIVVKSFSSFVIAMVPLFHSLMIVAVSCMSFMIVVDSLLHPWLLLLPVLQLRLLLIPWLRSWLLLVLYFINDRGHSLYFIYHSRRIIHFIGNCCWFLHFIHNCSCSFHFTKTAWNPAFCRPRQLFWGPKSLLFQAWEAVRIHFGHPGGAQGVTVVTLGNPGRSFWPPLWPLWTPLGPLGGERESQGSPGRGGRLPRGAFWLPKWRLKMDEKMESKR